MKMNQQIILRAFFGLSVAGLLNGCTIPRYNMATSTTEYNLVVEKAQNEMLLLNIVRASKRRPMYFTSFSKLTGSMSYEFQTGGISIPFGKIGTGLNGSYSITPSVKYSNSPLFDLAVQDSKEFTNGIMTPVPLKTFEYYWQQGWPKEMLLYLFIYRIKITDVNGEPRTFTNYPVDPIKFGDFKDVIEAVDWDIEEVNVPGIPGKVRDTNEASQLQTVAEILKLVLNKNEDKKEVRTEYVFKAKDKKSDQKLRGKIYPRSPEAILYYLGELVRIGKKDPDISMINIRDEQHLLHPTKLFYAGKPTPGDTAPCVSVDYEGVRYVIPQDPNYADRYPKDRSMHVLSLVSQLIGLQREIKEAPTTSVVSVIGGR